MLENYLKAITLIEKINRQALNNMKYDLTRQGAKDINDVQSFIFYKIGDKKLSVGELFQKECYLGSNVSYNLRKLVQNGYVLQEPNKYDRRGSNVSLTEKGFNLFDELNNIFEKKSNSSSQIGFDDEKFDHLNKLLVEFEKVLIDQSITF